MTPTQRIRRVALLCCHALRNLAYYRSCSHKEEFDNEFWKTVNGNFLDICVLEWCKLFGDKRGKHYWDKVITDRTTFVEGLLNSVALSQEKFNAYVDEMQFYRNKFIAHLDSERTMPIPELDLVLKSASYLYDYLLANEDKENFFIGLPLTASSYYVQSLDKGKAIYTCE